MSRDSPIAFSQLGSTLSSRASNSLLKSFSKRHQALLAPYHLPLAGETFSFRGSCNLIAVCWFRGYPSGLRGTQPLAQYLRQQAPQSNSSDPTALVVLEVALAPGIEKRIVKYVAGSACRLPVPAFLFARYRHAILEKVYELLVVGLPEQEKSMPGSIYGIRIRQRMPSYFPFYAMGQVRPADIYFTNLSDGAAAGAPRSSRDRPSAIEASSPLASRRAVSGAMPAFRAMMRPAASQ